MQLNWKGVLRGQELLPCQKNFQPSILLRKAWWEHIPSLPRCTVGWWACYAHTRCSPHTRTSVQNSTQRLANHCRGFLPVPLLLPQRDPPRKLSISKSSLRAGGCQGTFICRVSVWRIETACHAVATSNTNASPAAITGACRGNCTFLSLQPAIAIPWAVCPSPSVILPRESASARGSPQGNAVKNALYVLSFWFHFCMWFRKSPHPSHTFSLPEK